MGQALYRKYRSRKLSEIVGQEHITTTLEHALQKDAISHAYLFTGPRGVGKTSIARILAHEVNGLPYDESTHLDIIEIDAASNRRIDEIRDLRDHVHSAPVAGKYKVYIIDEVHMLTKEAFNALLKTLEEPPAHVIFILATTEAHKLPETIVSRTQRFTFKPVDTEQVTKHLQSIATSEKFKVTDEALTLIAEHGQGSFRDSISLLDQVSSGRDKVTLDHVKNVLGIAPDAAIDSLVTALEVGSVSVILQTLEDMRASGYHTPQVAKQLAGRLRRHLLDETLSLPRQTALQLLTQLIDVPASHDPETLLEIILLSNLPDNSASVSSQSPKKITKTAPKPAPVEELVQAEPPDVKPANDSPKEPETVQLSKQETILDESTWQEALNELKKRHNTLYGIARMASPTFSDDTVTLSFEFPFHQKRLDDSKHKQVLSETLSRLMDTPVKVVCVVGAGRKPAKTKPTPKNDDLQNISNIFGSAEVLE